MAVSARTESAVWYGLTLGFLRGRTTTGGYPPFLAETYPPIYALHVDAKGAEDRRFERCQKRFKGTAK